MSSLRDECFSVSVDFHQCSFLKFSLYLTELQLCSSVWRIPYRYVNNTYRLKDQAGSIYRVEPKEIAWLGTDQTLTYR